MKLTVFLLIVGVVAALAAETAEKQPAKRSILAYNGGLGWNNGFFGAGLFGTGLGFRSVVSSPVSVVRRVGFPLGYSAWPQNNLFYGTGFNGIW